MDCDIAREAISATLDGEDPGVSPEELDAHLAGCAGCVAWRERAAAVTRMARLEPAAELPDLTERVVDKVVLPVRTGRIGRLRLALLLTSISQFSIVVSQLFLPLRDGMPGGHLQHETAAFNFAVAVALLWVAARPGKALSQLPVLASFTGVLVVLSLVDVVQGNVGWHRLASHIPLLLGLLCTALLGVGDRSSPQPGNRAEPARHEDRAATTRREAA